MAVDAGAALVGAVRRELRAAGQILRTAPEGAGAGIEMRAGGAVGIGVAFVAEIADRLPQQETVARAGIGAAGGLIVRSMAAHAFDPRIGR